MDQEKQTNGNVEVNPRNSANIFSIITFFYNFKILNKGKKKDIEEKDIYKILPDFEAKKLGDKLESQWLKNKSRNRNASFLLCVAQCFGWVYLLYGILQLAFGTGMLLLQPIVFSKFVAYFETDQKSLTKSDAYFYASAVVGLDFLSRIYNQNFSQLVAEYSMKVRTAVCSLIFRKALKISPTSFADVTVGKLVTFLLKDVYSIDGALMFFKDMIIGYLQLGVVTYLLYRRVGLSTFSAIGVICAIILIQLFGGVWVRKNRLGTVEKSDRRYKILQETLSAIKIVKMYVWKNYFENVVHAARIKEIEKLKIVYWLKALIIGFGGSAISLSFYTLLMSYIGEGYKIDAETVYFVQQCLSALGTAVSTSIPFGITQTADTLASFQRIQAFLDKIIEHNIIGEPTSNYKETSNLLDTLSEEPETLNSFSNINTDEKITGNLYHEPNKEGKVLWNTYLRYFRFLGGVFVCLYLVAIFSAAQFCTSYAAKLISMWVDLEPKITDMINKNETNTTEYKNAIRTRNQYLTFYTILIVAELALFILKGCSTFHFCLKAAIKLHAALVNAMLNCYMYFFDDHYIGNIINRLSKDFYTIDEYMPFLIFDCSRSFFSSVGTVVLLASVNWGFIALSTLLFVTLFFLLRFYLPTGRSLRRLEAATRSPMIGYLNSTLEGISVIRATEQQEIVQFEFDRHQDLYTSAYYMNQTTTRLFAFLVDILGNLFILGTTFKFIMFPSDTQAGDVGLAISQAMSLSQVLQWVFKQIAEIETVTTSVERVSEYSDAPIENTYGQELVNWPSSGNINFSNVSLYYKTESNAILKNVTFDVNGNNKIGIVGRTGAGKSSLISTLFRLYNIEGHIKIDDKDICEVSLDFLRSSIGIIPQDPILFSGTIRTNIDPLGKYFDEDIWNALEMVHIKPLICDLNQLVNDSSTNFSAGQKQLICLARTIIQRNKIIVLDEATANLDRETDKLLQETVQECFENCTVLIIAHKLSSIMSCDKVIVLDSGRIVEFDKPDVLLMNKTGFLFGLLREEDHLSNNQN